MHSAVLCLDFFYPRIRTTFMCHCVSFCVSKRVFVSLLLSTSLGTRSTGSPRPLPMTFLARSLALASSPMGFRWCVVRLSSLACDGVGRLFLLFCAVFHPPRLLRPLSAAGALYGIFPVFPFAACRRLFSDFSLTALLCSCISTCVLPFTAVHAASPAFRALVGSIGKSKCPPFVSFLSGEKRRKSGTSRTQDLMLARFACVCVWKFLCLLYLSQRVSSRGT